MSNRIITPEAILSYPHVFTAQKPNEDDEDQKPKFGAALIFTEETDISAMEKLVLRVAKDRWGDKAAEMIRTKKLRMPFRDDIEDRPGYPEGSVFLNARSTQRPGVVSTVPDPKNGGRPTVITDPDELYAGCIVRASLTAFAYERKGNKGVTFGLNNIQKIREGERIDGRVVATSEFEADASLTADLSDLESESGNADETDNPVSARPAKKGKGKRDLATMLSEE